MAMNGVAMMLKSMGIDPEQIKTELTNTLNGATKVVKDEVTALHNKIDEMQRSANRMEQMLEALLKANGIAGISGALDNERADKVGTQLEERMLTNGGGNGNDSRTN